jgi:hypothetical protein
MENVRRNSIGNWKRHIVSRSTLADLQPVSYRLSRLLVAGFGIMLCAGCVAYGHGGHGSYDPSGYEVPAGHLPPPGECRIWYPDRPAGQQPPPGACRQLEWQVPPGAILIRG